MMLRRSFVGGLLGIIAAPAIVRVVSLMPVKVYTVEDFEVVCDKSPEIDDPTSWIIKELKKQIEQEISSIVVGIDNFVLFNLRSKIEETTKKYWAARNIRQYRITCDASNNATSIDIIDNTPRIDLMVALTDEIRFHHLYNEGNKVFVKTIDPYA